MIDDRTLKYINDLKRTLDSSGLMDAVRLAEEHRKALGAVGDFALATDILKHQKLLDGFLEASKVSAQMSNAVLSLGSAASTISNSVFGSAAMTAMDAMAKEQARRDREISAAFSKIGADQMAQLTAAAKAMDWLPQFTDLAKAIKGFDLVAFHSRFEPITRMIEATEASMRLVRWEHIAALDIAPSLKNSLEFRTAQLNRSFDAFAGVMAAQPEFIVAAPPFVAKMPTLAVFSHAEALRSISVPAEEEEESPEERIWTEARDETFAVIEELLPRISPELMTAWKGGWNTADIRPKDWARQAASSFRFVLAKVIDIAAPQVRVKSDLDPKLIKKGRASRQQQLSWLSKSLENEAYRDMLIADTESVASIINLFSEAVHKDRHHEIEKAFHRVAIRASVALRDILELYFNRPKQ